MVCRCLNGNNNNDTRKCLVKMSECEFYLLVLVGESRDVKLQLLPLSQQFLLHGLALVFLKLTEQAVLLVQLPLQLKHQDKSLNGFMIAGTISCSAYHFKRRHKPWDRNIINSIFLILLRTEWGKSSKTHDPLGVTNFNME